MKKIFFSLLCVLLVSFSTINVLKNSKSILVASESELYINGTSNVTDFKCGYNITNLDHPIRIHYENIKDVIIFENSTLILENNGFDCGGKRINKDFHGLLKSEVYPQITLKLKEVKLNPNKKNKAEALIEIEIAGLSHSYLMSTEFYHDQDWMISGKLKLNIQDFNLTAPKKMLGLVVVSEDIEISFKLILKEC
jgi:hypothetical protein